MRIEMHAHTSEVSPCAKVPAATVVQEHAKAGIDAIVITDHFNDYVLEGFPGNARQRVKSYLEGYERAREEGEKLGISVFLGVESRLFGGPEDFLLYGVDKNFLFEYPRLYSMTQKEVYEACCECGALLYQAHPCRSYCHPRDARYLHGVELYNGNPRHQNNNNKTRQWAARHPHFKFSSGSDYHQPEDLGHGGIIIPEPVATMDELVSYMKWNEVTLIENNA